MRARLSLVSFFGIAEPLTLAAAQDGRGVAKGADLIELVADVEDAAPFRRQAAQGFEQRQHGLWRKHRGRLVHDEKLRLLQQATHDFDALALSRPTCCEPDDTGRSADRIAPTLH